MYVLCYVDEDQCLVDNGGCEQLCLNLDPGYECYCEQGFDVNGTTCIGKSRI